MNNTSSRFPCLPRFPRFRASALIHLRTLALAHFFLLIPLVSPADIFGPYTYTVTGDKATITDFDATYSGALSITNKLGGYYPVTSIGSSAFANCTSLTSVTIPDSVTSIGGLAFRDCSSLASLNIGNSVTSISIEAFFGCHSLTNVIIPDSVTSIGDGAFAYCDSLTSVTIGNSVTSIGVATFADCTSLTSINVSENNPKYASVNGILFNKKLTELIQCPGAFSGSLTIPDSVTSIGNYAFHGCKSLKSLTIPESITYITYYAFQGCSSLTSIIVSQNNPNYASVHGVLFDKDITELIICPAGLSSHYTIPDSVTSICNSAFNACTSLTSITIPNSATTIGYRAFQDCTSLASVTISASVTNIGEYAFSGCTSLASVTIPDSVTSIRNHAFFNCTSLTSVTIPDSVTTIGFSVFSGCTRLTAINVDPTNPAYTSIDGVLFNKDLATLIQFPEGFSGHLTIPDSVTSIHSPAFSGCTSLTSISVSQNNPKYSSVNGVLFNKKLTELIRCFGGLSGHYTIPDSVTSICNSAFRACSALTSVIIPDSVKSIGGLAFRDCTSLTSITIPNSATTIGDRAFQNCTSLASVTIPGSVTFIGVAAFADCTSLASVTIPGSVTYIGVPAFADCTSLTSINVSENNPKYASVNGILFNKKLTELIRCPGAFSGHYTIPDSVTSIGSSAFADCSSLTSISVSENNPKYASVNGILFNKKLTELIRCPGTFSGHYTIPDSVTSIGSSAFADCSSLTSVTLPCSVSRIGHGTFSGCSSMTNINIPENIKIGDNAFSGCTNLQPAILELIKTKPEIPLFTTRPPPLITMPTQNHTSPKTRPSQSPTSYAARLRERAKLITIEKQKAEDTMRAQFEKLAPEEAAAKEIKQRMEETVERRALEDNTTTP